MLTRETIGTVLGRGLRRRCPRCGEGPLFRRGIAFHERCSVCNLQFQRNNGDTWMFMIITDRVPMLFAIAALYFGMIATTWTGTMLFFAAVAAPIIGTIRERQGLALALDYLSRVYFRDPSDEIHAGEYVIRRAA